MKCEICRGKAEFTFLEKPLGTFINKKFVCNNCQKSNSVEEIKNKVK
ncbi:MAG: hypothetical protein Q8Q42_02235 [Nanoarchaeota archaeon]|nr:hypothetical protein [Nanoarchaeota archaeon]